jgi:UDP-glucose 4-epimerase
MKALVTGSSGFVGRHLAAALAAGGYQVEGIDTVAGRWTSQVRDARFYFRSSHRFDVVVHAAAVVGGRATIDGNPLTLAVNLELDAGLFQWAARNRPGRVVYLSSSAAYPVNLQAATDLLLEENDRRLREDDIFLDCPTLPDALYGWIKLTGERLTELARAEGLPVTVVRPFSGYGADQDPAYPFAAMLARARAREDPFTVWGSGEQARDFIHIDDLAAAVMTMIRGGIDGPVNLGTGQPTTMRELARIFCRAAGYQPDMRFDMTKPAGVQWRVADPARMLKFYQPQVSLEDGITRALKETR